MQTYAFVDEATKGRLLSETRRRVLIRHVCYREREDSTSVTLENLQQEIIRCTSFGDLTWWLKQLGRAVASEYEQRLMALQGRAVERVADQQLPSPAAQEIQEETDDEAYGWDLEDYVESHPSREAMSNLFDDELPP